MDIAQTVFGWLEPFNGEEEPSPLKATFQLACLMAQRSGFTTNVDEETMTGAMLGAIASNMPWCSAVFAGTEGPQCGWKRYKKAGHGSDAESTTGSDFSLVIRLPEKRVRIAVFQAKAVQGKVNPFIDIHHLTKKCEPGPTPQFLSLKSHALRILEEAGIKNGQELSDLTWIHYVAYWRNGAVCLPMSMMGSVEEEYNKTDENDVKKVIVELNGPHGKALHELLAEGCAVPGLLPKPVAWLETDEDSAKTVLGELIEILDVYEADENFAENKPDLIAPEHLIMAIRASELSPSEKAKETRNQKARIRATFEKNSAVHQVSPPTLDFSGFKFRLQRLRELRKGEGGRTLAPFDPKSTFKN